MGRARDILLLCGCATFALTIARPARAADGAPATDRLTIDITASVSQRCGVSPDRIPLDSNDISRAQRLDFQFNIDCNTPFTIGVNSQHGAMRLTDARDAGPVGSDGFGIEKDYDVRLAVDTDQGVLDGGTCNSRALASAAGGCAFFAAIAGEGLHSGQRTAIGRTGDLSVTWSGEGKTRLAAGIYQDVITVLVAART